MNTAYTYLLFPCALFFLLLSPPNKLLAEEPPSVQFAFSISPNPSETTGPKDGWGLAVDSSGNSYVTGYFVHEADFDPGPGVFNLSAPDEQHAYLAKYNSSGELVYAYDLGANNSAGTGVFVDSSDHVYLTGYFIGTADFDPGPGISNLTSGLDAQNTFVCKFDSSGVLLWAKAIVGDSAINAQAIAVNESGDAYITGDFTGTADFDPGADVVPVTGVADPDITAFVLKLNSDGEYVWVKTFGKNNVSLNSRAVALDSAGNPILVGRFGLSVAGGVDFDPGPGSFVLTTTSTYSTYVLKLSSAGDFLWATNFFGTGGGPEPFSVAVDSEDNIIVAGDFSGTVDFDSGIGEFDLTNDFFKNNAYVVKLDSSGNFTWVRDFGCALLSGAEAARVYSVLVDESDSIVSSGYFHGTTDFDPNAGEFLLTSAGSNDMFIHKMDADGTLLWCVTMGGSEGDFGRAIALDPSGSVLVTGRYKANLIIPDPELPPEPVSALVAARDVSVRSVQSRHCHAVSGSSKTIDDILVAKFGHGAVVASTGADDFDLYASRASFLVDWNADTAGRFSVSGKINPAGLNFSSGGPEVTLSVNGVVLGDATLDSRGYFSTPAGSGPPFLKIKLSPITGVFSFSGTGIGALDTALRLFEPEQGTQKGCHLVDVGMSLEGGGLSGPQSIVGRLEMSYISTFNKSAKGTFSYSQYQTLTGVFQSIKSTSKEVIGVGHSVTLLGPFQGAGGNVVPDAGSSIDVQVGGAPPISFSAGLLISLGLAPESRKYSLPSGSVPELKKFEFSNKSKSFKLTTDVLPGIGIEPAGPASGLSHELTVLISMTVGEKPITFSSVIELLRTKPTSTKWKR